MAQATSLDPWFEGPPVSVRRPEKQTIPFVFSSPHSGRRYPGHFLAASHLDPLTIRRSEDAFVDELFIAAPRLGAPLVHAEFPRSFIDVNREPYELDPSMFHEDLPEYVNIASPRVRTGLGTIARVVGSGAEIYRQKLSFAEAKRRIERLYWPYHRTLRQVLEETRAKFGCAVLVECHSMPSGTGIGLAELAGQRRLADIVLGDRYGTSCHDVVTSLAEMALAEMGYRIRRNQPYAGGYITAQYGQPAEGFHALQIELRRSLYMDERTIMPLPEMNSVGLHMARLIETLGTVDRGLLRPPRGRETALPEVAE